jgi:hypothetical protein
MSALAGNGGHVDEPLPEKIPIVHSKRVKTMTGEGEMEAGN